jgi:hypothetical protein
MKKYLPGDLVESPYNLSLYKSPDLISELTIFQQNNATFFAGEIAIVLASESTKRNYVGRFTKISAVLLLCNQGQSLGWVIQDWLKEA